MNSKDYIAFISNGNELSLAGVSDIVDLELHDQVIQANECNCTHKEHIYSCEIEHVAVDVESGKKIKRYVVEMAFCKECAAYYIPQKSYEFLSEQGIITHHIKGGIRLFEYMKHGESFDEEKKQLSHIESVLMAEYNSLPKPISRYAIDDGCGGLNDIQSQKYSAKAIYEKQDEINELLQQPYIGRVDLSDSGNGRKVFYIGRTDDRIVGDIVVHSRWSEEGRIFGRTSEPEGSYGGKRLQVDLRRKIDIVAGNLRGVEDVFSSNSEFADKGIYDKFLIQVLMSRKKSHQLTDIIATIQDKQNEIIEKAYVANLIVQGCAGSGKTMVMLHRLSFWLYNNESLQPQKIKILTPNENFNVHIGGLHSQLNLGAIEIMSVDQYYTKLLDVYDSHLSFHKKIGVEEKVEERFLNYIYSKAFVKRMRAMYPEVISHYITSEELGFVRSCADKSGSSYDIEDKMSDGDKIILLSNIIGTIEGKNNTVMSNVARHKEKIDTNRKNQIKCDETIAEAEQLLLQMQTNYKDELRKLIPEVIGKLLEERTSIENEINEVKAEISKLSGPIRRLLNADAIGKVQKKQEKLEKSFNDINSAITDWNEVQRILDSFENVEAVLELFEGKKTLKTKNDAYDYLSKYKKSKRTIVEQNSIKDKFQQEIDKEQKELSSIEVSLTQDEYAKIVELKSKYPKDISLQVFKKLFGLVIADKLKELNMEQEDKVYRYELFARVVFAKLLWNKTVGEEELICVDEGQDVSFCEYEVIIEQNKDNGTFYNIFGDLNQRIKKGRGLNTWEQLKTKLIAHEYELNENYRNTNQITQYCNEVFNFDMTLTGVEGDPVRNISFKEMSTELEATASSDERTAVILPRTMAKTRVTKGKNYFSTKFDVSKISVMYVDEIKGIEFDRVYVVDEDMERNERYIAFTRALDKLTIVHTT